MIPNASTEDKTLYKLWYSSKADITHLHVWGCLAYTHIPKKHKDGKLNIDRATKYIIASYMQSTKI